MKRKSEGESREVMVRVGEVTLAGELTVPTGATGLVLFAHGSGSSRHSPRNRFVAGKINEAGVGTLLFDLLTTEEEREDEMTGRLRFDIGLLARRLAGATAWVRGEPDTKRLHIGYFGSSTGGAAALIAAAGDATVRAVVSRGGRPDLAGDALPAVRSPTLLIVGGNDDAVLDLNRKAYARLRCEKRLEIVPGATHLFFEAGALEEVARLASDWFVRHLGGVSAKKAA